MVSCDLKRQLKEAVELKDCGNVAFKKRDFAKAAEKYRETLDSVAKVKEEYGVQLSNGVAINYTEGEKKQKQEMVSPSTSKASDSSGPIDEDLDEFDQLEMTCNSNLAQVYLLQSQFELVLQCCDRALQIDPSNRKVLYRKAKGLIGLYKREAEGKENVPGMTRSFGNVKTAAAETERGENLFKKETLRENPYENNYFRTFNNKGFADYPESCRGLLEQLLDLALEYLDVAVQSTKGTPAHTSETAALIQEIYMLVATKRGLRNLKNISEFASKDEKEIQDELKELLTGAKGQDSDSKLVFPTILRPHRKLFPKESNGYLYVYDDSHLYTEGKGKAVDDAAEKPLPMDTGFKILTLLLKSSFDPAHFDKDHLRRNHFSPVGKSTSTAGTCSSGNSSSSGSSVIPLTPPENLIIVCHGFGDSYAPFKDLPKQWKFQKTAYLFLNGFEKLSSALTGIEESYSWFTYFDMEKGDWYPEFSEDSLKNCEQSGSKNLHRIIDILTQNCGWRHDQIFLCGFSQGGTYILDYLLNSKLLRKPLGGVIGISTVLLGARRKKLTEDSKKTPIVGEAPVDYSIAAETPMLIIHGEKDDQLSARECRESIEVLEKVIKPKDLRTKILPNRGHTFLRGTHEEEILFFYRFMSDHLNGCGRKAQIQAGLNMCAADPNMKLV